MKSTTTVFYRIYIAAFYFCCGWRTISCWQPNQQQPQSQQHFSRRRSVLQHIMLWIPSATSAITYENDVTVLVQRPGDSIGLELINVQIGTPVRSAVAIQRVRVPNGNNKGLVPGMILKDFHSAQQVQETLKQGPYPVKLVFTNLAAGNGDAISDLGTPLVTAQDALQLARQTASRGIGGEEVQKDSSQYKTTILRNMECNIQSRRNDVLEIIYEARLQSANGPVYDSSERRGTGRPYQMVLGSGDMLPGVDLGLYDMCPGEIRTLQIPPSLAYGAKGNKLYQIPPNSILFWKVKLVTVNSVGVGDTRTRDEMEMRTPYQ